MRHLVFLPALALVAFGATVSPALASLPRQSGVVLAVLAEKHELRVVQGPRVFDAGYRGALPSGVAAGARIGFALSGQRAVHVALTGHADHVSVVGFVVRSGKTVELRLADESILVLPRSTRLKVGALARVVVRFSSTGTSVGTPTTPGTAAPPSTSPAPPAKPSASHCARSDCSLDVTGSVTAIDGSGALTILPVSGGTPIVVSPGQVDTDEVSVGDFLEVIGTQSATTGVYTATSIEELVGCDRADCTLTLDALVDEVDPTTVIVEDDGGDEYQIGATAQQLSTIAVGDTVHIVGTQDPQTGNYTATTITVTMPAS